MVSNFKNKNGKMKNWKFNILYIGSAILSIGITIGFIIVAIHFIAKYW